MREAVVVSTARTPIGKAYKGAFADTQGQELAALLGDQGQGRGRALTVLRVQRGRSGQVGAQDPREVHDRHRAARGRGGQGTTNLSVTSLSIEGFKADNHFRVNL